MFRSLIHKATEPIHGRLRAQRSDLAVQIMQPEPTMSLLDLGGAAGYGLSDAG